MKYLNRFLFFVFFIPFFSFSQAYSKYSNEGNYNSKKIISFSKTNNAYNFMALGYYLDSNNMMFNATQNKQYLDDNLVIVKNVLNTYLPSSKNYQPWLMSVSKNNQNSIVNGQEHLISEGYFFRYLGDFIHIIETNNLYKNEQENFKSALKFSFDKWNKKSLEKYNDQSMLYHQGFDIGANWAIVALYVDEFFDIRTKKNVYKTFYTEFDKQLKKSIAVNSIDKNDFECYVWNSTYPEKFTNMLNGLKNYSVKKEDVSHANHTVNYVLTSFKLNKKKWNKDDLIKFSNTISNLVWDNKSNSFSDFIDGTNFDSYKDIGWKQSDGYMKLIKYNNNLKSIYLKYFDNNKNKIINSSLGFQFQANLFINDTSHLK